MGIGDRLFCLRKLGLGTVKNNGNSCTSVARTLTSIFSKTHIWIIETINGFFYSHFLSLRPKSQGYL
ncbi:hypothetical protein, partial [Paenibacillus macerans]|uniref:hypothetical protein n=1 Tax=Paenibacillus macerans TaxID=44252 RepID=UPI001E461B18